MNRLNSIKQNNQRWQIFKRLGQQCNNCFSHLLLVCSKKLRNLILFYLQSFMQRNEYLSVLLIWEETESCKINSMKNFIKKLKFTSIHLKETQICFNYNVFHLSLNIKISHNLEKKRFSHYRTACKPSCSVYRTHSHLPI